MKLVEETPSRLVLDHRPWGITSVFLAILTAILVVPHYVPDFGGIVPQIFQLFAAAFIALFLLIFGVATRVEFDRSFDRVTISRGHLLPFLPWAPEPKSRPLSGVKRAMVLADSSGEGTTYTVSLVFEEAAPPEILPPLPPDAPWYKRLARWLQSQAEPVPTDHWPLTNVRSSGRGHWQKIADIINRWLGVSDEPPAL